MAGDDTDALIKSFEPMMHKLLHKFGIKRDYEDNLQELRYTTWQALLAYDANKGKHKKHISLSTFVYKCLQNRLANLLRVEYRIRPKNKEELEQGVDPELTHEDRVKYNLANPEYDMELAHDTQIDILTVDSFTEKLRLNMDFELFLISLPEEYKDILELKTDGRSTAEISKKLNISKPTVLRRLNSIKKQLKKYLIEGYIIKHW